MSMSVYRCTVGKNWSHPLFFWRFSLLVSMEKCNKCWVVIICVAEPHVSLMTSGKQQQATCRSGGLRKPPAFSFMFIINTQHWYLSFLSLSLQENNYFLSREPFLYNLTLSSIPSMQTSETASLLSIKSHEKTLFSTRMRKMFAGEVGFSIYSRLVSGWDWIQSAADLIPGAGTEGSLCSWGSAVKLR